MCYCRSSPGERRNHAIDRDVQHCPHHIGERVNDDHERDRNFIGKPERPQHNRQRRQRGKPADSEGGKRGADRENRQQTQIDQVELAPHQNTHKKRCDDEIQYSSEPDRRDADGDVEVAGLVFNLQVVLQRLKRKRNANQRIAGGRTEHHGLQQGAEYADGGHAQRERTEHRRRQQQQSTGGQKWICEKRQRSEGIRTESRNLRRDQGDNADRHQQTEPVEDHRADCLDMPQSVEDRLPGFTFGQYHADAEDRREHQHAHAIIRRQRGEYVGRDEGENAEIRGVFDFRGVARVDGEFDIDRCRLNVRATRRCS